MKQNHTPDFINRMFAKGGENKAKKSEYIAAIIVNIILLYIFNNLLNWHVYFITNALNSILWIINLAIIITILGNILLLAYNPGWFRHVMKIILNMVAIVAVYNIFTVFPFNFNSFLIDWSVTIALIFIMAGIAIATIVELFFLIIERVK